MAFSVALQLYSVRDYAERDLKSSLQKIREIGYEGVELAGLYGHTPIEIKEMLDEVGLTPISAHVPLDDMLADAHKVIAEYAQIGCSYIAIPYLSEERRPGTDGFEQTIRDIEMLSTIAQQHGIHMLYHNHDYEFETIDGEYALDIIYQSIPSELLQTQIDTCWVHVAGEDPAEYIRKYADRTPVVQLKDFVFNDKQEPVESEELIESEADTESQNHDTIGFRPLGNGVQNFPAILTAAEEAGAKWLIVEQDRPSMGKTSMECAEISRKYLKNLGI